MIFIILLNLIVEFFLLPIKNIYNNINIIISSIILLYSRLLAVYIIIFPSLETGLKFKFFTSKLFITINKSIYNNLSIIQTILFKLLLLV
jgi:hypothetical protein